MEKKKKIYRFNDLVSANFWNVHSVRTVEPRYIEYSLPQK